MSLLRLREPQSADVNLAQTFDAIVVGSGAAGGMAAHVLTSQGLQVLMVEAGRKLDIEKELRSMEWPYDHPRRGDMPPGSHGLGPAEYTLRKPPYAQGLPAKHVYSYVQTWNGTDYSKNIVVDEKDHPYTGTSYAWVRARCLGGKTNIWGRLALRLSDYDFKAKSRDGFGEDWPISYADLAPYYVPRFRNLDEKRSDYIRAYGFEGNSGAGLYPGEAHWSPGFGAAHKKFVRDHAGAYFHMGGFGEVLARRENRVSLDPTVADQWGIPVLRFDYRFGDNERKMAADMLAAAQEMVTAAGIHTEMEYKGNTLLPEFVGTEVR